MTTQPRRSGRAETAEDISGSHGSEYEDDFSEMLRAVIWQKLTDVSEMFTACNSKAVA
jgi:hypothetical protein